MKVIHLVLWCLCSVCFSWILYIFCYSRSAARLCACTEKVSQSHGAFALDYCCFGVFLFSLFSSLGFFRCWCCCCYLLSYCPCCTPFGHFSPFLSIASFPLPRPPLSLFACNLLSISLSLSHFFLNRCTQTHLCACVVILTILPTFERNAHIFSFISFVSFFDDYRGRSDSSHCLRCPPLAKAKQATSSKQLC